VGKLFILLCSPITFYLLLACQQIPPQPKIIKPTGLFTKISQFSDSLDTEIRLRFQNGSEYAFSSADFKGNFTYGEHQ
jgi:hypothetical protein